MRYLSYILLFLSFSCKTTYIPDNEIIIKTLSYKNDDKLPTPEENCFLRIELLDIDSYKTNKIILYDTVRSDEIKLTPENNLLSFGHIAIKAAKNNKSAIYEIIYKGGSIQLNLIIK
jgi:hypothetical protein